MNELRFAPLIRVSTEKQKQKGESLQTQETQIRQFVNLLKGTVPADCWKYRGQEHATPDQERTLFDQLLKDSSKGVFDAVIVTDASRWSRDNLRSEEGLKILSDNRIRFFVGMQEFDLHDPNHRFMLGMSTLINEMQAKKQSINSILNRIERAKRGMNAAGVLPYGRIYDKPSGQWGIDKDKQQIIQRAAERYLSGEGIPQIANTIGMNAANLHRILTKHSGSKRTTRFKYKHIDQTITFEIPALLSDTMIEAIRQRIYANTTTRGRVFNSFLLVGYIYCSKCGTKLQCRKKESGTIYYLHHKKYKQCCFRKQIQGRELESAVLLDLVRTFGDADLIERAIQRATPDLQKVDELTAEKTKLEQSLKQVSIQKGNIIDKVARGLLTDADIEQKMTALREQETGISQRLLIIERELSTIHDPVQIRRLSKLSAKVLSNATRQNPTLIFKRSFEWKRKLIERAFSGVNSAGNPLGIYITVTDAGVQYEVRGMFENTISSLPLTDDKIIDTFHLDDTATDIQSQIEKIRNTINSNISGKYLIDLSYTISGKLK